VGLQETMYSISQMKLSFRIDETIISDDLDIQSNVGGSISKTHATLIDDGSFGNIFEKDDAGDGPEDIDQHISNTGGKLDEEGSELGGAGDHVRYTGNELDNEESESGSLGTLANLPPLEARLMEDYNEPKDFKIANSDYNVSPKRLDHPKQCTADDLDDDENVDVSVSGSSNSVTDLPPLEARWMERYNELREYKLAHGHCNVPRSSSEHSKLAGWVSTQRKQYKKDSLANNRVQFLNDVGFVWSFEDQNEIAWELRLNELKEYRSANGHCNVPASCVEHPALANWVKYQRARYREGCISDDRVELLNDVGFEWSR